MNTSKWLFFFISAELSYAGFEQSSAEIPGYNVYSVAFNTFAIRKPLVAAFPLPDILSKLPTRDTATAVSTPLVWAIRPAFVQCVKVTASNWVVVVVDVIQSSCILATTYTFFLPEVSFNTAVCSVPCSSTVALSVFASKLPDSLKI